jgi:glutamate receptor, ionotropic, invertebrate
MFISAIVANPSRLKGADLSAPWMAGPFCILIPIPNSSADIGALIKPMSIEVSTKSSAIQFIKTFHSYT